MKLGISPRRLKRAFPNLISPAKDDICYATQNRQDAVKELIKAGIDLLLVVGSRNSSNSIRLCEVARAQGVESHLIDNASEIQPQWLAKVRSVGLTAGASAPDYLVEDVVKYLQARGATVEELEVIKEDVSFALPRELLSAAAAPSSLNANRSGHDRRQSSVHAAIRHRQCAHLS